MLSWIIETPFFKRNRDDIHLKAQFPIGDYLRQIDKRYDHPAYCTDFLLLFKDADGKVHNIIIEYDGFREHFCDLDKINEFNHDLYYKIEDVERQKILESYGYTFLRINRFNVGGDPVGTLDRRLESLVSDKAIPGFQTITQEIKQTAQNLESGVAKRCPKCLDIKLLEEFEDSALKSGYGRHCRQCKGKASGSHTDTWAGPSDQEGQALSTKPICPKCGKKMVTRIRRADEKRFWGCPSFPRCRGTRDTQLLENPGT